jgi:pimeloyl-ACP methyl ester carboxylesterase
MAQHALAFLDGMGVTGCDVLGFSLGGMIAQQMAQDRPAIIRRMILVATAPRGGEDIMHLEKPSLARFLSDPNLRGYAVLGKLFFAPTDSSQAAADPFPEEMSQKLRSRLFVIGKKGIALQASRLSVSPRSL